MAAHDLQDPVADVRSASKTVQDAEMIAAGATVPALNTHHIHILSVCGFVGLWILLAQTLPSDVLPGPLPVLGALWDNVASGDLFFNVYRTLMRVFLSFGLAMLVGVPIGVAMGLNKRIEAASVIWVIVLLTVPGLVYLILMFMWFGLNELSTILAITITGLPSVIIVVWEGVKNIDNKLAAMARAFGVPNMRRVAGVLVPQLLPYLFSATRFGLGVMWKITVFAELLGRSDGVGFKLNYWYQLYNMKQVLAWTLAFTLVMIALELGVIRQLERRLFIWRPVAKL
jgi:NitT/TauT family transport system permease protein